MVSGPEPVPSAGGLILARGLDVVLGYQVSWNLMFEDYTRYTRSERKSAIARPLRAIARGFPVLEIGTSRVRRSQST